MIPFLGGIKRAIYNLNKRIDLLLDLIKDMLGLDSSSIQSLINILNDKDASTGILNTLLQKADKTEIPKNTSDLVNDSGYVTQQNVVANEAFPSNWPKSGNMSGLISAINQDNSATQGKIYLATVSYDDLPTGLMLAEMKVEITVGGSGSKVILFTIISENVAPYHWEYTSAYGRSGHWRSFLTSHQDISGKLDVIDSNHKLSSDLVDDTNKTHKFVTTEEKEVWNNKQDALIFNTAPSSSNKVATMADIPSSLPVDGGNAATVNNHSVNSDVPANAVFTDNNTTYKININGTDQGGGTTSLGTVYVPTEAGTEGQILIANENGIPVWGSKPSYSLSEVGAIISVLAISSDTSSSCSITGAGNAGKSETIIYTNSESSDLTVTVPTTYQTPNGEAIELTCPASGYCEVSYINISGTIYARGL